MKNVIKMMASDKEGVALVVMAFAVIVPMVLICACIG